MSSLLAAVLLFAVQVRAAVDEEACGSSDWGLTSLHAQKIKVSELDGEGRFAYVWNVCIALLCAATFVVLLIIMVKVVLKVGRTDLVLPTMLVNLSLAMLSKYPLPACLPRCALTVTWLLAQRH